MKTIVLAVTLGILTPLMLRAQFKKSDILLGGSLGLNFTRVSQQNGSSVTENKSVAFRPEVGIAVKKNRILGLQLIYQRAESGINKPETYGVGAFLRQYQPIGKSFYFYHQTGLDYIYSTSIQPNFDPVQPGITNIKNQSISLNLGAGLGYQVSRRVFLDVGFNNLISAGYSHTKFSSTPTSPVFTAPVKQNNFNLNTNLNNNFLQSAQLAFRIRLGKD